jgi:hypothetical protein
VRRGEIFDECQQLSEFVGRFATHHPERGEHPGVVLNLFMTALGNIGLARVHTYQGRPAAARGCGEIALAAAAAMGGWVADTAYAVLANAALAGGDGCAAKEACEASWQHTVPQRVIFIRSLNPMAEALLACGCFYVCQAAFSAEVIDAACVCMMR